MNKDIEVGVKLTADGKSLVGESRAASEALRGLGETAKTANNESAAAAERFTANLKRQADTLGMTASQVRAYDAAQMELNQAQRASVEASNRAITAHENQQVALDDLRTRAAAAGVALGTALVTGLKASITAAGQAEQSHLRLQAVLNGTRHAAGLTKGDLDQMADGMKDKLGIDDDALRDSMAVLLTFRNVSRDSFGEALETSANLAAVMQTDLKSAVLQLGKALESPDEGLTALKRSGVSFSETQKDMIKDLVETGRQAEAITLILKTMKEQGLDGVAESMNQGITKASRDATMAWDDLLKAIGGTDTVKNGVDVVLGSWTGYLKDMRQVIESGDWLDRLAFFTIGLKTPDMIAKSNAPAAAVDPAQQALADEGLARQKAAQQAEIAAIAKKKADEEAAKAAEEASKRAIAAARAREEAEKRAYQQSVDSSNKFIAALKLETEQIGLNAIQKKMLAASTEAAKAPNDELRKQIMAEASAYAQLAMQQEQVAENKRIVKEQSEALAKLGNNQTSQLRQQLEDLRAQNALIGLTKEQVTALAGAKERETAAVVRNAAVYAGDMHDAYIRYANDLEETDKLQQQLMQERQVQQYAQTWNQTWSSMEQTGKNAFTQFAAHGESALGSIKESLKLSVIDLLYQVTARPWIIQLGASLQSSFVGAAGANAASSGMNALNVASMASNGLSLLKSGFGATSLIGTGLTKLGGFFGSSSLSAFGGGFAGDAIGGLAAGGFSSGAASAASLGASVASFAGPAIAIAAVDQITRMLAGDKLIGGGVGKVLNYVPVLGPLLNGLFGRGPLKQRGTSLTGEIGADGFESGQIQTRFVASGGLFRSDKTDFARVDAMTGQTWTDNRKLQGFADDLAKTAREVFGLINDTTKQTSTSLRQIGKDLGVDTEGIDKFSYSISILSDKGKMLTEEQIGQEIEKITDGLARSLLPQVDELAKRGETALQTVSRLGTEFNSLVDAASLILGKSAADAKAMISDTTFQGRTAFVDAAGGTDALGQKAAFYSQNFYSSEELLAQSQTRLGEQLQALGLSTDLTKDQFKGLVESFGQVNGISESLLQSLLNLAPAFVQVRTASDQLAAAEKQRAINQVGAAYTGLQKSVETERNRITEAYNSAVGESNKRIQDVSASIGKLKSLSEALKSTVDQIRPLSHDEAKYQVLSAINAAKLGGGLPDADSLRNALSVLGNKQSIGGFSGSFEFAREQAKTANLVEELGSLTGSQLSTQEQSLLELQDARKLLDDGFKQDVGRLDSLLTQGQLQIDALDGISAGVLSLAGAIGKFNTASGAAGGGSISGGSLGNPDVSNQQIIDYFKVPRTPEEIVRDAGKYGVTSQQIVATGRFTQAEADQFFKDNPSIPRFAKGGVHRGGLRIVGENGPELEMTGPASITSNNDLIKLLNNKDVVDKLQELIAEAQKTTAFSRNVSNKLDAVTIMSNGKVAIRTGTA